MPKTFVIFVILIGEVKSDQFRQLRQITKMATLNEIAFDTLDSFLSVYSMDSRMNYRGLLWWQIIWKYEHWKKYIY